MLDTNGRDMQAMMNVVSRNRRDGHPITRWKFLSDAGH